MIETDMGIIIGIGNVMMNGIEEDLVVGAAQGRLKLQKGVEGQSKTGPSRLPWHEYSSGEACTLVNVALVSLLRMLAGPVATIIMQEKVSISVAFFTYLVATCSVGFFFI